MGAQPGQPCFRVRLEPVPFDDKAIVSNLMQLCQHDYSEFEQDEVNTHGLFGYRYLDPYWTDPDRHPRLIKADDQIAGFALIHDLTEAGVHRLHCISEFFVLRRYRRNGVGRDAARQIILGMPGPWVIQQALANLPARAFWLQVVRDLTAGDFHEREVARYHILEFHVDGRTTPMSTLPDG